MIGEGAVISSVDPDTAIWAGAVPVNTFATAAIRSEVDAAACQMPAWLPASPVVAAGSDATWPLPVKLIVPVLLPRAPRNRWKINWLRSALHSIEKAVAVGEGPKRAVVRTASQRQPMPALGTNGAVSRRSSRAIKLSGATSPLDDRFPFIFPAAVPALASTCVDEWQPANEPIASANAKDRDRVEMTLFIVGDPSRQGEMHQPPEPVKPAWNTSTIIVSIRLSLHSLLRTAAGPNHY